MRGKLACPRRIFSPGKWVIVSWIWATWPSFSGRIDNDLNIAICVPAYARDSLFMPLTLREAQKALTFVTEVTTEEIPPEWDIPGCIVVCHRR